MNVQMTEVDTRHLLYTSLSPLTRQIHQLHSAEKTTVKPQAQQPWLS